MYRFKRFAVTALCFLTVLITYAQRSVAEPVTFAFEGEVTSFLTQRVEDDMAPLGVQVGTPFRGHYVFESTTLESTSSPGYYADALLGFEIEVGSWQASMDPAPTVNSIDLIPASNLYRVIATGTEQPEILARLAKRNTVGNYIRSRNIMQGLLTRRGAAVNK